MWHSHILCGKPVFAVGVIADLAEYKVQGKEGSLQVLCDIEMRGRSKSCVGQCW